MSVGSEDKLILRQMLHSSDPMWPGALERGGDPALIRLEREGLIEVAHRAFRIGRFRYSAGYVISPAGKQQLASP